MQVTDNPKLLSLLLQDAAEAPALYRPTPYWQPYAARIADELQKSGLTRFRRNQVILKGFGSGGTPRPTLPRSTWKRAVWRELEGLPVFRTIVGEYQRLLGATVAQLRQAEIALARHQLAEVAARYPALSIPDGIANGDADDALVWQGMTVTAHWVMYLTRAADFYSHVDPAQVTSILEIGPGLGLSSLAHLALNPHLRVIVNVDIVPVTYVSSCFLSSSAALQVTDYAAVRDLETIDIAPAGDKPRLWSLPSWSLPKIRGRFDYAFNAFSFQEMEEVVCENYAREVMRLTRHGVQLHSRTGGHKVNAGGQAKPIAMEDLQVMLQPAFPHSTVIGDLWAAAAQRPASEAVLLRPA